MSLSFDKAFDALINWQTALFCLGVYVITYFIRTLIEGLSLRVKQSNLWKELWLPLGPIVVGVLLAMYCAKNFPWPMPIADTSLGKGMYGGICGMASGWVYARFRAWLHVAADKGNDTAAKLLGMMPASGASTRPPKDVVPSVHPPPDKALSVNDRPTDPMDRK